MRGNGERRPSVVGTLLYLLPLEPRDRGQRPRARELPADRGSGSSKREREVLWRAEWHFLALAATLRMERTGAKIEGRNTVIEGRNT
jgi:hypothetical protein